MLSRTADHLYWMARYMERAENLARMLDTSYRTSLLPQTEEETATNWGRLLQIMTSRRSTSPRTPRSHPKPCST